MSNKNEIIKSLQFLVTNLSQAADLHAMQSRIFASQGFSKLAEKYKEHVVEEREFVVKFMDRILDLGGELKLESKEGDKVYKDAVEFIKADFEVSKNGLGEVATFVENAKADYTTYDLLKEYYKDEESDMYWLENQLELIEMIGKQNWLVAQL
ncbi:bacterioferritin (cytochrome b1) [Campylobacter sp. RM9344]|uniref:Bacterioferritin (Cytochrome b1) n=1 Tax=Campylobacter californiensis TaxID=1032243 RepID=A0AAW3ZUZ7_9BACT|nr:MULTISPECIES: ferritin-like domain-containing protein [unclassified Campylobacter]MBE2985076.1 bacterioferritin (cytochrome b1) [Campylobacter sp. RM6883]MBE2995599.1 bacterioferritin (cytochrome b1) [Campylobacter sp. RM6913]MBE3029239.1 bacterioferritin (cytochrome b1) [Campylobacter sp. RM9344]MBE3608439.1 bacterioferritin (cytochrome b1) [Campylobacter sp. RM9337]QCD50629.1 bacterioferritin (cytochrome b1) [Campylobacter sp. RM6914]